MFHVQLLNIFLYLHLLPRFSKSAYIIFSVKINEQKFNISHLKLVVWVLNIPFTFLFISFPSSKSKWLEETNSKVLNIQSSKVLLFWISNNNIILKSEKFTFFDLKISVLVIYLCLMRARKRESIVYNSKNIRSNLHFYVIVYTVYFLICLLFNLSFNLFHRITHSHKGSMDLYLHRSWLPSNRKQ